jgi:hypothetical protein
MSTRGEDGIESQLQQLLHERDAWRREEASLNALLDEATEHGNTQTARVAKLERSLVGRDRRITELEASNAALQVLKSLSLTLKFVIVSACTQPRTSTGPFCFRSRFSPR